MLLKKSSVMNPPYINPTKKELITEGHDAMVAAWQGQAEATEARIETA